MTCHANGAISVVQMPVVSFVTFAGPFAKHMSWVQGLTDPQGVEGRLHEDALSGYCMTALSTSMNSCYTERNQYRDWVGSASIAGLAIAWDLIGWDDSVCSTSHP